MATPLRLKSERVGKVELTGESPYLSVLVDTGVFHLDHEYDYSLPAKFSLDVGDWVSVPFNGRNCLGLITKRSPKTSVAKVQPVNRGAKGPRISVEHLKFYQAVANRWAVPIFDVLRFVSKYRDVSDSNISDPESGKRIYIQLPANVSELKAIDELATRTANKGETLVIVPEARVADALQGKNYDVAMRGGSLSPKLYKNIVVLREDSEHHYEIRSPGFNSRDVTLLRNDILKENLIFVGYSPSLEMARLIDNGYVEFKKSNSKTKVLARPSQQGELIPSTLIKEFKSALSSGPVLVLAPAKGYGLAISCASCKNIAHCDCGGKLSKQNKSAHPSCVICAKKYPDWKCRFCNKDRIYLLGRGIERIAEEFGRTFPNTEIHIATAEKGIEGEISKRSIVLATVGSAPELKYSTVLLLEGTNLGADLRSEERYLSTLFKHAAYSQGSIMVVERPEHPAVNALIKWNPLPLLNRTLNELAEAKLPPTSRHALIKSDESERIYSGFLSAIRDKRLPEVRVHNLDNGVVSIFFDLKNSNEFLSFVHEFQRRRSMSGKKLLKLRIDPYLLG